MSTDFDLPPEPGQDIVIDTYGGAGLGAGGRELKSEPFVASQESLEEIFFVLHWKNKRFAPPLTAPIQPKITGKRRFWRRIEGKTAGSIPLYRRYRK